MPDDDDDNKWKEIQEALSRAGDAIPDELRDRVNRFAEQMPEDLRERLRNLASPLPRLPEPRNPTTGLGSIKADPQTVPLPSIGYLPDPTNSAAVEEFNRNTGRQGTSQPKQSERSSEKPVSEHPVPDTITGRVLDYIGMGFLLAPPEVLILELVVSSAPVNWTLVISAFLGCYIAGFLLLGLGLNWQQIKPKLSETLAANVTKAANSVLVWLAVLLFVAFGPSALVMGFSNSRPAQPSAPRLTADTDSPEGFTFSPTPLTRIPPRLGPLSTLRIIDSIATRGNALTPRANPVDFKWALVITATKENDYVSLVVRRIVGAKIATLPAPPPNPNDLDAPKLTASGQPGITLHGNNQLNDRLFYELGSCFDVKKTAESPSNLQSWYENQIPTDFLVDWIDIGPGSPWKEPFPCSD
jgi:hypothetical protein